MEPKIELLVAGPHRRCYCCGGSAYYELVVGHTTDGGRNGNTHALALCLDCRKQVAEVAAQ